MPYLGDEQPKGFVMERILNMILRRLVNKGINSGMRAVSNRGKRDDQETETGRKLNQNGQQNTKNLRQATRMLRRMGRF